MLKVSNLPKILTKKKRRAGRGLGSGAGAKSGRGTGRHQKARGSIKIWFEGGQNRMIKKFPLLRGKGKNRSLKPPLHTISISDLNKLPKNLEINLTNLLKYKIIDKTQAKRGVKVLSLGELTNPYIIDLPVSSGARAKIEKSGGKIKETI